MKTPHLFFALLATTFLLHSSLEAADFKSSSSQQVASPSSDSDPYNLHKIVSYYRAARPDPSIIIEGVATPNNYNNNNYNLYGYFDTQTGVPPNTVINITNFGAGAVINFTHNDMLYFVFDDFVPPTIANGWPQKNDYWTWESSQANVIYYLGQGTQSVDRFYLYRGGFTPNPESKIMYSLPDYMSPADRYEASGYFIAGTPGTTTLTLSHFANVSNTTPDHVSSFTITVPEESLKVKKNSNNFLPVGSDS